VTHSITICENCGIVITQCKCISKNKTVILDLCHKCQKEIAANHLKKFMNVDKEKNDNKY
jgi:hypothetical protein